MSRPLPPIPPPPGTSTGNSGSPYVNRVDTMPTNDSTNTTTTTTNVVRNVVEEINDNLPQLLDSRGGSHVLNVPKFDKDDFTSWKISFLVFLEGLEPYLITTLEEGPYVPLSTLSTLQIHSQRGLNDRDKGQGHEKGKVDRGKSDKEDEPSIGKGDARSIQWVKITMKKDYLKRSVWYLDSGDIEGYGLVNCNGITFMRVAYVIGLKHNLISLSQLCDANYKVLFTKTQGTFKTKRSFSISKSLHLLHMDLFRPVKPQTIIHNKYTLVIVDEYSRNTWVFCLKKKSDAADCIMYFIRQIETINDTKVKQLRSDNGTKFKNQTLEAFCDENGISQNFSSPCTPEQNGVAEKRNRTSIEVART
ncbi:retrovirus-related pol polyprotein from transposon TNT 1-94, partial [Tanacetum coccineum]